MRRTFPWRFTYFGEHSTKPLIKIGASARPFARMKVQNLKPLGLLPCYRPIGKNWEIDIHYRLQAFRAKKRSELFRDCDAVRRFIIVSGAHANLFLYHRKFLPERKPYQSVPMTKLYRSMMEWARSWAA